ncbi:TssN family type VI secretion system protein [Flavobacterium sp.]|uniref:TssN family type VI secretion system protein n=1 Tax=Flavobacterium sp. TaxID=239 RepID=UPI00286DEC47|nr:TssN family type VI secretion system protein [Flavobacterium sp.]
MRRYLSKINGGEAMIYVFLIIAIAMVITILISSKTPKLKEDKKSYIIYIIVQALIFLLFGGILYNLKDTSVMQRFVSLQFYFGFAGTIHLYLFHTNFKKFDSKKNYTEIFIAFVSAFYLAAFVAIIAGYFNELPYLYYLIGTLLFFTIPTLTYSLFEAAISIPVKLHKRWFYPLNTKYPLPQASEMRNIIILNLVFQKKEDDNQIINFKVKAPKAIDYGRLFYYFINDYNEKNPVDKIKYVDDKDQPYGWYFYTKPKWFGSSQYIDPEVAIDANNVKDGETIICQRI